MFKIGYDKKIIMVQGDTGVIRMKISNYELSQGDEVRFAIVNKANPSILLCQHSDKKIVLEKQVTVFEKDGSARIVIFPYDTEYLQPGKYLYEIQVVTKDGRTDTVVPLTALTLMDGSIQGEFGQTTPSKPEPTPSEIELRFKRLENEIIPELGNRITNVENEIDSVSSSLDNIVHKLEGDKCYNIIDFGAIGDSVTDNTLAFIKAFNEIPNNSTLIIPNGEYIVYKNNEGTTQGNAALLEECILLKNKENITIIGEGNVLIRPNNQGVSDTKKRYPCTISIDKCVNVVMKNVNVESKGENYGDADAGISLAYGDGRTNFNIQNGGSALHISRSKNVKIYDGKFRFCGSCGVVYFSSVSNCGIYNSFSNPASLGYASYAVDTWVDYSNLYTNDVEIINCSSWAETVIRDGKVIGSAICSSKASVGVEGDTNLCKATIKGCTFKDCYANGSDTYLGMAIFSYNSDVLCENNIIENCALALYKRDTLTNDGIIKFINNTCLNLTTNGIVIKDLHSLSHTKEDIITNNFIHVAGGVTWEDEPHLLHNHGVVIAEVRDGTPVKIENNTIKVDTGVGITKYFKSSIKVSNNSITSKNATLDLYGGGDNEINNNKLSLLQNDNETIAIVDVNTSSIDSTIYDTVRLSLCNNSLFGDKVTRQSIQIKSTDVNNLFVDKGILNNSYINCTFNVNSSNYKLKKESQYVKLVNKDGLMGEYTVLKFDFSNKVMTSDFKIVDDGGTIRNCIFYSINKTDWYEVTCLVSGDIRGQFSNETEYMIF